MCESYSYSSGSMLIFDALSEWSVVVIVLNSQCQIRQIWQRNRTDMTYKLAMIIVAAHPLARSRSLDDHHCNYELMQPLSFQSQPRLKFVRQI